MTFAMLCVPLILDLQADVVVLVPQLSEVAGQGDSALEVVLPAD